MLLDDDDAVNDTAGDVEVDCEGEEEGEPAAALGDVDADADAVIDAVAHAEVLADIVPVRAPELVELELMVTVTVVVVENCREKVARTDALAAVEALVDNVKDASADSVGALEIEFVFEGLCVGDVV